MAAIFIDVDVDVDADVAVANGTCIDNNGDDSVVGVGACASGEFVIFRVVLYSPREDRCRLLEMGL